MTLLLLLKFLKAFSVLFVCLALVVQSFLFDFVTGSAMLQSTHVLGSVLLVVM